MMDEKYHNLVAGYLNGTLSNEEQVQFQKLLDEGKINPDELIELQNVWQEIGAVEKAEPRPGSRMTDRFYAMLEEEKASQPANITGLAAWRKRVQHSFERHKASYAAAIFICGLIAGNLIGPVNRADDRIDRLTAEIYEMRELMVMSLLENDSPAERLRAVNIGGEIPASGSRVADALLQTLNRDSNVNVRIAAVDALISHASNPAVRSGMIESITRQESPLVQIALADAMIALQERGAADHFKKLLEQDDMDHNVRNKIENTILALN
jgi:HEAT repeat protein